MAQCSFHVSFCFILETVQVCRRFLYVAGFHDGDDDAAVLDSDVSRIIALAALVEGYVLRISASASEAYIRFLLHRDLLDAVYELGAFEPCFVRIAADHAADLAVCIHDGMNEEARFDHIGSFLHIIGNRVVIKERGTGSRVDTAAEFSAQRIAVIDLNGFITGNARENQLSAAAVACEEVGGDAVDDDDLVSIDCMLIDPDRSAQLRIADMDEFVLVFAVMLVQLDTGSDFLADDADIFFRCLRSVSALGKEDADIAVRDLCAVQFIDDMDDELIRMVPCTGNISAYNADFVALSDDFLQRAAADRMAHAFQCGFFHVASGRRISFKNIGNMFFREHDFLSSLAEAEFEFF